MSIQTKSPAPSSQLLIARDFQGGARRPSCPFRPVLLEIPSVEPFLGTGLPFLARCTTEDFFETGGRHLADDQTSLCGGQLYNRFRLDRFDRSFEPTRGRSEECDRGAMALASRGKDGEKPAPELC